jgi:hypothetical protein
MMTIRAAIMQGEACPDMHAGTITEMAGEVAAAVGAGVMTAGKMYKKW